MVRGFLKKNFKTILSNRYKQIITRNFNMEKKNLQAVEIVPFFMNHRLFWEWKKFFVNDVLVSKKKRWKNNVDRSKKWKKNVFKNGRKKNDFKSFKRTNFPKDLENLDKNYRFSTKWMTKSPQICIRELGRTTGMFLYWPKMSRWSRFTFIAKV